MPSIRARALLRGLLAAAVLAPAAASAQEERQGPVLKTNAVEIEINGRVHTQLNTTSVDGEQPSEILLRRVRLEARVKVNDVVSGKVQPDFAGDRVSLKDAYVRLTFDPAFEVLAGKAHRPFSTIEMTSSNRILPIERGLNIRGVENGFDQFSLVNGLRYSDRDIGLQVLGRPGGAPLGLSYQAGVFRGPLHGQVGAQDSYQFAARLGVQPASKLKLGAAWSSRQFAYETVEGEDPELERGHAFEVDAEWGAYAPGLHLLAELSMGDADPATGSEFKGAQGWVGWRSGALGSKVTGVEPIFRASYGALDLESEDGGPDGELGGTLLTPGINVYFGPLNRIMLNYDLWSPRGDGESERSFKAQFQVAF